MAILTEKTKIKEQRNHHIKRRFKQLFKGNNQKQAVYELIHSELCDMGYKCCLSTVQKIANS